MDNNEEISSIKTNSPEHVLDAFKKGNKGQGTYEINHVPKGYPKGIKKKANHHIWSVTHKKTGTTHYVGGPSAIKRDEVYYIGKKEHSSVEEIAATKRTPEQEAFHSHPWIKKLKEQGFKERKSPIPGVKLMKGGTSIDHLYRDGEHHIHISHEHSKSRDVDAHTGWIGFGRHKNIHEALKAAKKSFKAGRATEIKHIKSDEKWARREKERNNAKLKLDRIHQTKNIVSSLETANPLYTVVHQLKRHLLPHSQAYRTGKPLLGKNWEAHAEITDPAHHHRHMMMHERLAEEHRALGNDEKAHKHELWAKGHHALIRNKLSHMGWRPDVSSADVEAGLFGPNLTKEHHQILQNSVGSHSRTVTNTNAAGHSSTMVKVPNQHDHLKAMHTSLVKQGFQHHDKGNQQVYTKGHHMVQVPGNTQANGSGHRMVHFSTTHKPATPAMASVETAFDKPPLDVHTPTIEKIAEKHGVTYKHILDQLIDGITVEHEHTTDDDAAMEIALDHLNEDPNYYTKLRKMENSGVEQADINFRKREYKYDPRHLVGRGQFVESETEGSEETASLADHQEGVKHVRDVTKHSLNYLSNPHYHTHHTYLPREHIGKLHEKLVGEGWQHKAKPFGTRDPIEHRYSKGGTHIDVERPDYTYNSGKALSHYKVSVNTNKQEHSSMINEEIAAKTLNADEAAKKGSEEFHAHPFVKKLKKAGFKGESEGSPFHETTLRKGQATVTHGYDPETKEHHVQMSDVNYRPGGRKPGVEGLDASHKNLNTAIDRAKKEFHDSKKILLKMHKDEGDSLAVKHLKQRGQEFSSLEETSALRPGRSWVQHAAEKSPMHHVKQITSRKPTGQTKLENFDKNWSYHKKIKDPAHHLAHAKAHKDLWQHHLHKSDEYDDKAAFTNNMDKAEDYANKAQEHLNLASHHKAWNERHLKHIGREVRSNIDPYVESSIVETSALRPGRSWVQHAAEKSPMHHVKQIAWHARKMKHHLTHWAHKRGTAEGAHHLAKAKNHERWVSKHHKMLQGLAG